MKSLCAAVVLTFGFTAARFAADQTLAGDISDSHCGAKHTEGQTAARVHRTCVKGGASYVFVSSGKVCKLEGSL